VFCGNCWVKCVLHQIFEPQYSWWLWAPVAVTTFLHSQILLSFCNYSIEQKKDGSCYELALNFTSFVPFSINIIRLLLYFYDYQRRIRFCAIILYFVKKYFFFSIFLWKIFFTVRWQSSLLSVGWSWYMVTVPIIINCLFRKDDWRTYLIYRIRKSSFVSWLRFPH